MLADVVARLKPCPSLRFSKHEASQNTCCSARPQTQIAFGNDNEASLDRTCRLLFSVDEVAYFA